jgi:transcriptional regulator with XRE-family HTH domain
MGIMQKDLAKALSLHPSQITARMRGRVPFSLDELEILARMFHIEPVELLPRPQGRLYEIDHQRTAEIEDVRRQGLEPRTRWLGASQSGLDHDDFAVVLPFGPLRRCISHPRASHAGSHQPYAGLTPDLAAFG